MFCLLEHHPQLSDNCWPCMVIRCDSGSGKSQLLFGNQCQLFTVGGHFMLHRIFFWGARCIPFHEQKHSCQPWKENSLPLSVMLFSLSPSLSSVPLLRIIPKPGSCLTANFKWWLQIQYLTYPANILRSASWYNLTVNYVYYIWRNCIGNLWPQEIQQFQTKNVQISQF